MTEIREQTMVEAMRDGLAEEMRQDPRIVVFGEGIGARGGNFNETLGLFDEFGPERLVDTPISETGFTGLGIGAAMSGLRPVVNLMFVDFFAESFSQILHQAAKIHYLSGGQLAVPIVFWGVTGAGGSIGAQHAGSLYPLFMHIPGLKVVVPSTPADAKGLLISAIRDDGPVVFLPPRLLCKLKGPVPGDDAVVPLGKAEIRRPGEDVTVVAIGRMVHEALEAAQALEDEGISAEVIDLRTLVPMDDECLLGSVARTGRLVIVDEAHPTCSAAAEIAARAADRAFAHLRAPIRRVQAIALPHALSPPLEAQAIPDARRVAKAVRATVAR